jgi:DNA-directed RNA polymerase specialized sigma24 family protein
MDTGEPEHQKLQRLEELFWVTEAQAGNTDAFVHLMSRYEKRLLYYLRRIVPEGDWALDLHQEVWLDAYRGLASLQAPEAFRVWIYRIAHHKAARFIRNEKLRGRAAEALADPSLQEQALEAPLDAEVLHQRVREPVAPVGQLLVGATAAVADQRGVVAESLLDQAIGQLDGGVQMLGILKLRPVEQQVGPLLGGRQVVARESVDVAARAEAGRSLG